MDIRITKAKVKNHWHYSWWKYLALVTACIMGVNMLFTTTAYRPPDNKKIELYLCSGYADAAAVQTDLWPALQEAAPDQELLSVINIDLLSEDVYATMQFTTYMGAGQGDVLLLPKSAVGKLTQDDADGVFLCLDEYLENGLLDIPEDVDLSAGMLALGGVKGVYAVPADTLYGLTQFSCDPADSMLCVTGYTANPETAARVISLLFDRYQTEKPDWYKDAKDRMAEEAASETQLFR